MNFAASSLPLVEIGLITRDRDPMAPVASALVAVARSIGVEGALRAVTPGPLASRAHRRRCGEGRRRWAVRIIVEGAARPARWIRMLNRLTVVKSSEVDTSRH